MSVPSERSRGPACERRVALTDDRLGQGGLIRRRSARVPARRSSFTAYHFPTDMITVVVRLAVCWYLLYGLSHRDVEELLAERGVGVDHVTVCRWVQRFTPLLIDAARPVGTLPGIAGPWMRRMKVAGRWCILQGDRPVREGHRRPDLTEAGIWRPPASSSPAPSSTAPYQTEVSTRPGTCVPACTR